MSTSIHVGRSAAHLQKAIFNPATLMLERLSRELIEPAQPGATHASRDAVAMAGTTSVDELAASGCHDDSMSA